MTASVRIVVSDNDGDEQELTYVVDNLDTFEEAVELASQIAAEQYAHSGIIPRGPDGTPYWGKSDENEVNQ